jgi:hypothetical protein
MRPPIIILFDHLQRLALDMLFHFDSCSFEAIVLCTTTRHVMPPHCYYCAAQFREVQKRYFLLDCSEAAH